MKVLLSWLREFAPFEGDPVALGNEMSDLGMAVESIDYLGAGLDGIVVARVLELRPHPNADKIQLVDVDRGGEQRRCGGHGEQRLALDHGVGRPPGASRAVRRRLWPGRSE